MTDNLMTCAQCDELFLDFFEDTLGEADRDRFDNHVSTCVRCQSLIRDIDGIRDQAAALPDMIPARDLWSGIEARIQPQVRSISTPRASSISKTWLAAAAAALIVATSGVTYLATSRSITSLPGTVKPSTIVATPQVAMVTPEPSETGKTSAPSSAPVAVVPEAEPARTTSDPARSSPSASLASAARDKAPMSPSEIAFTGEITQLQTVLTARRSQLDPETVKVVEDNLKLIDSAVKRARAALEKDPASGFLTRQLDNALQKKVELLRTVALLPSST